jgi:hypothetical protein
MFVFTFNSLDIQGRARERSSMPEQSNKEKTNVSTALVVQKPKVLKKKDMSTLSWASENINGESLADVNAVKDRLPVILGKILALCWLNNNFQTLFLENPSDCLEKLGIETPEDVSVTAQTTHTKRPSIIVFERRQGSNFKLRLFSLSLTLMASK